MKFPLEVTDNGLLWKMNKQGVICREKPDQQFKGFSELVFCSDLQQQNRIEELFFKKYNIYYNCVKNKIMGVTL